MYESFFGFDKRPFNTVADQRCFFPGATIVEARNNLERVIERGEGPGCSSARLELARHCC